LLEVLDHSSKELAGLSNCTSLVFAPNNIDRPLKHVEFVALDKERALVITIDINGLVENKIMTVPSGITAAALIEATNYINSKVYGKTLSELKLNISKELETQNKQIDKLSEQLVSEGLAIRSKEKGEDHFLINRRDFIYGKLDQKEELFKLDKLLNELQNKKNFINILKKNSFKNKNLIKHDLNKVKKDNQSKISNNNKLTYKLEHELSIIPSEIEKLETIISQMNNILSDADLYTKNFDKFLESSKTLEMSKKKLDELETRWLELDLKKNKL